MSATDSPEPESGSPAPPAPAPAVAGQYAPPPPANPFVPRYREPWVNPAKKGAALAVAAGAAVVLLALGFLLGLGLGGHRHGLGPRHELQVVLRHPGMFGPPHGWARHPGAGLPYRHPGRPAPTLVPSTSHS